MESADSPRTSSAFPAPLDAPPEILMATTDLLWRSAEWQAPVTSQNGKAQYFSLRSKEADMQTGKQRLVQIGPFWVPRRSVRAHTRPDRNDASFMQHSVCVMLDNDTAAANYLRTVLAKVTRSLWIEANHHLGADLLSSRLEVIPPYRVQDRVRHDDLRKERVYKDEDEEDDTPKTLIVWFNNVHPKVVAAYEGITGDEILLNFRVGYGVLGIRREFEEQDRKAAISEMYVSMVLDLTFPTRARHDFAAASRGFRRPSAYEGAATIRKYVSMDDVTRDINVSPLVLPKPKLRRSSVEDNSSATSSDNMDEQN